jgi:hypothetical protein
MGRNWKIDYNYWFGVCSNKMIATTDDQIFFDEDEVMTKEEQLYYNILTYKDELQMTQKYIANYAKMKNPPFMVESAMKRIEELQTNIAIDSEKLVAFRVR